MSNRHKLRAVGFPAAFIFLFFLQEICGFCRIMPKMKLYKGALFVKKIIAITAVVLAAFATTAFAKTVTGTVKVYRNPGKVWDKSAKQWVDIEAANKEQEILRDVCEPINIETEEETKARLKKEKEEKKRQKAASKKKAERREDKELKEEKPKKEKSQNNDRISGVAGGKIFGKIFG